MLVAIFSQGMTTNIAVAVDQSKSFVKGQTALPAAARAQIVAALDTSVAAADTGGAVQATDLARRHAGAAGGFAAGGGAGRDAGEDRRRSSRTTSPSRFAGPTWRRRCSAFLAVIPALLTGKRLGEHAGHHEMNREQRAPPRR